jgi:hypothetical protein
VEKKCSYRPLFSGQEPCQAQHNENCCSPYVERHKTGNTHAGSANKKEAQPGQQQGILCPNAKQGGKQAPDACEEGHYKKYGNEDQKHNGISKRVLTFIYALRSFIRKMLA